MQLFFSVLLLAGHVDHKQNARDVVVQYVAAALSGKVDDAVALAVEGQSPSKPEKVKEFKTIVKAAKIQSVWEDEGNAIAVSDEIKDKGYLVFALVRSKDKWLVKDIDLRSEEKAKEQVEKFKKKYPKAKESKAVNE